jgi:hypothetical protein
LLRSQRVQFCSCSWPTCRSASVQGEMTTHGYRCQRVRSRSAAGWPITTNRCHRLTSAPTGG